jgi:hypothetical protein
MRAMILKLARVCYAHSHFGDSRRSNNTYFEGKNLPRQIRKSETVLHTPGLSNWFELEFGGEKHGITRSDNTDG